MKYGAFILLIVLAGCSASDVPPNPFKVTNPNGIDDKTQDCLKAGKTPITEYNSFHPSVNVKCE